VLRALVIAIVCVFVPAVAPAQSVSDVLSFLLTNQSVQTGSVERDRDAARATSDTISRALLINLATIPVPSSSSAFVYRLNPDLGTVERSTESFGPFFVERAQTAGRGQASIGMSFQHLRFTSLDGRNLRDGSLVTTANQFTDEAAPFDLDRLALNIDASIATLYGQVGLTNRAELGVAVPLVSLRLDGSRINTYRGREFTQATADALAIGVADVLVRTKYTIHATTGGGVAAAADLRLPTGRTQDLLGAGSTSLKLTGIGFVERGPVALHANFGATIGGLAQEVSYDGAAAFAASPRMTVIGELLGRSVDSPGHILSASAPHPLLSGVETIRLVPDGSRLTMVSVVTGVKWNVANTWVLAANVSIPLTTGGLTTAFTPFIGLDYSLGP
jgi:hypothetical protein